MIPVWAKALFYISFGFGLVALGLWIAPSRHAWKIKGGIRFVVGLVIALAGCLLVFVAAVGAWMIYLRAGVTGLLR